MYHRIFLLRNHFLFKKTSLVFIMLLWKSPDLTVHSELYKRLVSSGTVVIIFSCQSFVLARFKFADNADQVVAECGGGGGGGDDSAARAPSGGRG